jgi:DNA-binding XRE family transcriptional regulator
MPRAKPVSVLLDPVLADPDRREEVLRQKRSIEIALRLGKLREECCTTQTQVAQAMNVSQPNISRIEHEEDIYLSTLREYVEALGGELEINVVFPDRKVRLEPAG